MILVLTGVLQAFSVKVTSNANPKTTEGLVLVYFGSLRSTNFVVNVKPYQCDKSQEGGVTYFHLPTENCFPARGITYDGYRHVIWLTSVDVTYDDWGGIETYYGIIIMLNITDGSVLFYGFPVDVGEGFNGPGPLACALDDNGYLWITISDYLIVPEQLPENIPSIAMLNPENATLTVFWLPKEFGWLNDLKFYWGAVWCQSVNYLVKIFDYSVIAWKISDVPSMGFMYFDDDCAWITRTDDNEVKRFNTTTGTFDANFTDFSEPLGIYGDSNRVYVAESGGDSIAVIDKRNLEISCIPLGIKPTFIYKSVRGSLWWASSNSTGGYRSKIGVISKIWNYTYSIKCGCGGPIVEGLNNTMWFSGYSYNFYLGPPYVTCNFYICVRSDVKSPDVNKDGKVNARDVTEIILDFNAKEGEEKYKPQCDIDSDGVVNARDVTIAVLNFMKTFEDP